MVLEFGTARAVLLRMPDGPHRRGEGGGAYAYAPARHRAVFLFGRLRRWTRDRGCDLAHLTKFFARVGERGQTNRIDNQTSEYCSISFSCRTNVKLCRRYNRLAPASSCAIEPPTKSPRDPLMLIFSCPTSQPGRRREIASNPLQYLVGLLSVQSYRP
jgi:hypothetical protein